MFRRFALLALVTLAAPVGGAEPSWYEIELIVFERMEWPKDQEEVWPESVSFKPLGPATELQPMADNTESPVAPESSTTTPKEPPIDSGFRLLSEESLKLTELVEHLRRSRDYRPLLHVAWRQAGDGPDTNRPVHIHSRLGETPNAPEDSDTERMAPAPPTLPPPFRASDHETDATVLPVDAAAAPIRPIDGTIMLRRGRYLHLDLDVRYRKLLNPDQDYLLTASGSDILVADDEMVEKAFVIQESRRVRFEQLNYFDHPLFGLIAVVRPFEPPPPDPEPPEQAGPTGTGSAAPAPRPSIKR